MAHSLNRGEIIKLRINKILFGFLLVTVGCACGAFPQHLKPPSRWITLPDPQVEIDGLPWYHENHGELYRLPLSLKDTYPRLVRALAKDPSGGRIRFRTDSTALAVRLEYPYPPGRPNMQAYGESGVDLYVDNEYWGTAIAGKDAGPGKIFDHVFFNFSDGPRVERNITLYLPLYMGVKVLGLGIDSKAVVKPPQRFAVVKPVVYYGTSITQGGVASRPGMSYEAIVGRRLNIDFVNLGFSEAGNYEHSLAKAVATIDASCYILDGTNLNTAESMRKVFPQFIETIRTKHQRTPILVITPIFSSYELIRRAAEANQEDMRAFMRRVVSQFIAKGDNNIQLIEGTDLLGPLQGDGLTDGVHPNDLGIGWIANGLTQRLARVLRLNSQEDE